jgi:hypothetical protein
LSEDPLSDEAVKSWLAEDCSWGISEAATILFPEVHRVELPDLLSIEMTDEPDWNEDRAAWNQHQRARQVCRSLVETLPYRDSGAITQRTIDLLNDAQPYLSRTELYGVLFALAPQPGNRLNGEGLHQYLLQRKMPERDSDFGLRCAASCLTRRARQHGLPAGRQEDRIQRTTPKLSSWPVFRCAGSCLLRTASCGTGSPKAQVQLLRGHLDVMRALVERFWTVDDPYVVQRVVVIAHGSVLPSSPEQADQAKALAELVHNLVFRRPIRPDELLLDAARGVVRWAVAHQLLPASALDSSRRPYGLKVPSPPPTEATIKIDPSLPPIDYRAFNENGGIGAAAWSPPLISLEEWSPARLDFGRYRGDVRKFLADTESEPTVASSMFVRDRDGNEWVVLESFVKKVDPLADKGWGGLQEHSVIDTLLIKAGSSKAFLAALPDEPRHDIRDLVDSHGHTDCCYVGEVGRVGPSCPHRHDALRPVSIGGKSFQTVPTIEQYTWEGSILDCSIGESATAVLPSTFIQRASGLTFDLRGPSWLDATGTPIFTYYEEVGNDSRALLRKSFLRDFLVEHKLELIVLHWYERMQLRNDYYRGKHPFVESSIDGRHEDLPRHTETDGTRLGLSRPRRTRSQFRTAWLGRSRGAPRTRCPGAVGLTGRGSGTVGRRSAGRRGRGGGGDSATARRS